MERPIKFYCSACETEMTYQNLYNHIYICYPKKEVVVAVTNNMISSK